MAASGFTPIQLYRSSTASAVPLAANLAAGELAINTADVALFAENSAGTVTRIMNNPAGLIYPTADGTAGQVISTNGSGVLSFGAAGDVTLTGTQTLTNKTISGASNTLTVDGTTSVGFRTIPQNSQSVNYTLVLDDSGRHIFHPVADNNARTFTIPANSSVAFPVGTAITFINMAVANITIAITTDTLTLSPAGTSGSRTLATNGSATCIKITSTQWLISGSGLT